MLDILGNPKYYHSSQIESIANTEGAEPFDIEMEYDGSYDKINHSKSTPDAILASNQWMSNGKPHSIKGHSKISPTSDNSLKWITPGLSSPKIIDLTDHKFYKDNDLFSLHFGKNYVNVRNILDGLIVGSTVIVDDGTNSQQTGQVVAIEKNGPWSRIYV
ncbi:MULTISPECIES: hypothetical protein [unclassified Azospirillum]|uniref:hypothetical protein n=1 Tax=unclassified Azospirillum TaxID=2630922 RepID=UPI001177F885|nr:MULTISPECIES: hypothetical protein [unclassified Azospirillum]